MSDVEDFDTREVDVDEDQEANDPEEEVESPKTSQHKKHRRRDEEEEEDVVIVKTYVWLYFLKLHHMF